MDAAVPRGAIPCWVSPGNSQGETNQGLPSTAGHLGSFPDCLGEVHPSFPLDAAGWHTLLGRPGKRGGPERCRATLDDFYEWCPSEPTLQAKGLGEKGWQKEQAARHLCRARKLGRDHWGSQNMGQRASLQKEDHWQLSQGATGNQLLCPAAPLYSSDRGPRRWSLLNAPAKCPCVSSAAPPSALHG